MLKDIQYEDRIEATGTSDASPITVEIRSNPPKVRMIGSALTLRIVDIPDILIDYGSINASFRMGEANRAAVAAP